MGEHIVDNAKREAMKVPFLRDLLLSDSIYIASNITFDNLGPLSTYLGKPGDPAKGGLPFAEYQRRQAEFREAEIAAAARHARGSSSGPGTSTATRISSATPAARSARWVDPDDPADPVLGGLAAALPDGLDRGDRGAYATSWSAASTARPSPCPTAPTSWPRPGPTTWPSRACPPDEVDPDDFIRWTYARALAHRQPLYAAMARQLGRERRRPRTSARCAARRTSSRSWPRPSRSECAAGLSPPAAGLRPAPI